MNIEIHPLAELFPPFTDYELGELRRDIKMNGLKKPITLYEGKILDGIHRFKICQELGKTPKFKVYRGNDPCGEVISENSVRRHMSVSARVHTYNIVYESQWAKRGGDRDSI